MKTLRFLLCLCLLLPVSVRAQQMSTYGQGLVKQINAASARAYLGVGTNGGGGDGTVTLFSADPLTGLFDVTVLNPSTTPHLQFQLESQSQNLVFASPVSSSGTPFFRLLSLADLPALPYLLTITNASHAAADVSMISTSNSPAPSIKALSAGTGVTLTDQGTDVVINASSGNVVLSITNADWATTPPDVSLITTSNPPIPSLKGLKAGGNVTLTDNGTSVTITAANSAGGASGIDLSQTNMPPFDGQTNFYLDFSIPAQVLVATGAIYFNYATNWGLANTSRVANIYISPTNFYRPVYFVSAATNWQDQVRPIYGVPTGYGAKLTFQVFGQGNTNVVFTPSIDLLSTGTNWLNVNNFNPTSSVPGCVFWLEASQKIFQDEFGVFPATDGQVVRSALDLSLTYGRATNAATTSFLFARSPNNSPGNIPALNFTQGGPSWLVTSNFTALAQTNTAFIMWYGRGTSLVFLDGSAEGNRFACLPTESPLVTCQVYSGTSLTFIPPNVLGWRLFTFQQNSSASLIRTNGVQAVSGNSGTQTPARWTVGSDYSLDNFTGNAYVAEILVYHGTLSLVNLTNIENYFRFKYPFQ